MCEAVPMCNIFLCVCRYDSLSDEYCSDGENTSEKNVDLHFYPIEGNKNAYFHFSMDSVDDDAIEFAPMDFEEDFF